jgi:SpoVK/Ycf46/Vps4 family AAA+-type ATPase
VDLSLLVSKYIGETEKNLARVFEQAERQRWILFFDEADALFGKRSDTNDAHDRYANQEVAYLLQRIETFEGVAILASNLHQNLDEAFLRRFEAVVYFPPPRAEERLRLWREGFSTKARVTADLERIARQHDLSGGAIINVIRRVSLAAIARGTGEGGGGQAPDARSAAEMGSGEGMEHADGGAIGDGGLIGDAEIEEAIRAERGKQS